MKLPRAMLEFAAENGWRNTTMEAVVIPLSVVGLFYGAGFLIAVF